MRYIVEYSPEAEEHLRVLTARQQSIVLDTVERQLSYHPMIETRNRKPMRPNPLSPWELRIGELRVFYDVSEVPSPIVSIVAVGIKKRNQIYIGKGVIKL